MLVKAIIGRLAVAPDEHMTYWLPVHFGILPCRDIDVTSTRLHLRSKLLKCTELCNRELFIIRTVYDVQGEYRERESKYSVFVEIAI